MQIAIIRALAISGLLLCFLSFGSTQITFSKGWGPGKRSMNDDTCKLTTNSVMAVCHTLWSELRRLAIACEARGPMTTKQPNQGILHYQML